MKRKTLVSCLIILFVLMSTAFSSVSAESNNKVDNNNRVSNVTINEYQWAKKMNELSREELKDKGLSNEEIDSIRNYKKKFKDHYKEMANIPENQLEHLGYTKEQVELLKKNRGNSNYTEDEMVSMAASVNVTLTVDNFYYDSSTNRTKARLDSRFQWSGVPSFKMTDILAISWNNYMQTGKAGGVTYRHIYGTQSDYFKSATYLPPEGGMESYGGGYKWSVSEQDNYFYTHRGYAIFVIEKANYNHLEAYTAYGHQQGYAKLSYSVRSGVDVQFNLQRKNIGDDHFSARYP